MKQAFFAACLLCAMMLPVLLQAQSDKELSAKANFQLAEEAYDNKEYNKGLNYLEEAKKDVGEKPKLLFLQIMIEQEMISDVNSIQKLLDLIGAFEKSNGIDNFSNEKKMLVAKNKVLIKERLSQQLALEEKQNKEKKAFEEKQRIGRRNFENFTIKNFVFGLTVEEFRQRYPDILPGSFKKQKARFEGADVEVYYPKNIFFERDDKGFSYPLNASSGNPFYDTTVFALIVKENKVVGFSQTLFYYNSKGQGSLSRGEAIVKKFEVSQQFVEQFAFPAESDFVSNWYWRKEGKSIKSVQLIADDQQPSANKWKSSLIIRVINFPK